MGMGPQQVLTQQVLTEPTELRVGRSPHLFTLVSVSVSVAVSFHSVCRSSSVFGQTQAASAPATPFGSPVRLSFRGSNNVFMIKS